MRALSLLNLILYVFMGFHTLFDGHIQVLCIEKDGQVSIETYDLAQTMQAKPNQPSQKDGLSCCPDKPGECGDCQDIYIGSGHPDTFARWSSPVLDHQDLADLQALSPLMTQNVTWIPSYLVAPSYPPPLAQTAPPVHIPSTVLLI